MIEDGSKLSFLYIGDSSFNSKFGTDDVLVFPDIKKNLIFVSQLAKDSSWKCAKTSLEPFPF